MAELIEALPTYTTTEALQEHQSATPASFQIPPVLRRKVQDCTLVLRPNRIPGLSYAETGINGDLYLSEASLVFWSEALKKGLSVGYPTITLHAISRKPMQPWIPAADSEVSDNAQPNGEHPEDLSAQPEGPACIFCQLDMPAEADPEDAEDEYETTDLIITPPEQSNIDDIFQDFCHCASLFPSAMSDDDQGDMGLSTNQPQQSDDAETGATDEVDWDAKVDWGSAPSHLRPSDQHKFEDAKEEGDDIEPEPKKQRIE